MINNLVNPGALDASAIRLLGNRAIFIPADGRGVFMVGHMLNPNLAKDETTKDIFWAPYGQRVRAKQVVTQTLRSMEFQTQSSADAATRALHAGDILALSRLGIAVTRPWAAGTALALGAVVTPTAPNGYSYEVTVAGTTGTTEPEWGTTTGGTTTDGTVTFTAREQGADPEGMFVVRQVDGVSEGMFVVIWDSAEGDDQPSEMDVFPAVQLRGTGKPQGGDGENETQLGWTVAILDPANDYELPAAFGSFPANTRIPGQVTLMNVPRTATDDLVNALSAQVNA